MMISFLTLLRHNQGQINVVNLMLSLTSCCGVFLRFKTLARRKSVLLRRNSTFRQVSKALGFQLKPVGSESI